ncbi:MAG: phage tail sheath subtilisin-like domain-containing protein, partial [Gammaproteobacteria bacterium]|nr:phage tail sheath subtilisin-like domain-containing protein [Gammaproteobacteria bacterium]
MPSYLHPGVYVEEIPSGSRPIEGVATSVAAFVGAANRGPIGEPVLIGNFDDYVSEFGEIESESDDMGLAVQAYYLNGGGAAFICRLASGATSAASVTLQDAATTTTDVLTVTATSPGAWGSDLYVRAADPKLLFDLDVSSGGTVEERFYGLSLDATRGDFVSTKVNGRSSLIRVDNVSSDSAEVLLLGAQGPTDITGTLTVLNTDTNPVMVVTDLTDGSPTVSVTISNISFVFDIHVGTRDGGTFTAIESFSSVSMLSTSDDFAETIINGESALITVDVLGTPTSDQYPVTINDGDLDGNDDGEPLAGGAAANPTAPDYTALYENTLRKYRDISIIVLPGQSWAADGSGNPVVAATLAHCESIKNRMVIVDPPAGHELENSNVVTTMSLPTSTYSVLYYPWVDMANPLYHPDKAPDKSKTVQIPPSAIAAGMWAKIDGKRGVWKAPAGVEARLTGAAGLEFQVENLEQDQLNPLGVNCIRKLPNFGSVFWGARTLSTNADPEWRYVPVRRTAIMIEESIYRGIQWAVFEPNDHPLWSSLRANIG